LKKFQPESQTVIVKKIGSIKSIDKKNSHQIFMVKTFYHDAGKKSFVD
jgi:hypothetical protein